jgi:hypothetical protein
MTKYNGLSVDKPKSYKRYQEAIELLEKTDLTMREIWQRCAPDLPYHSFILELQKSHCPRPELFMLLCRRVCGKR